jgi:hypothetical protein
VFSVSSVVNLPVFSVPSVVSVEVRQPLVEQSETLGRIAHPLVREVVRDAREGVDGGDVRPHRARQEQRRDRKVLVVRPGEAGAGGVGRAEPGVATDLGHRLAGGAIRRGSSKRLRISAT